MREDKLPEPTATDGGSSRESPRSGSPSTAEFMLQELQLHQLELEAQNRQLLEAQESLEVSRAQYVSLYDCAPVAYVGLDARGVIREINLTGAALLKGERPTLLGLPFSSFVARPYMAAFRSHVRMCIEQGTALGPLEFTLERAGTESIIVQVQSVPYDDAQRDERLCRMAVLDVTPLARAREREAQSLLQYKALLKGIPDAVVRVGADGELLDVHLPSWALPLKAEHLLGKKLEEVMPAPMGLELAPLLERVRTTQMTTVFERRVELGGQPRWIEVRLVASGPDVTVLCRDISELRLAQTRLDHAERLAALGTLSAGLAHEVNNPLAFVLLSLDFAERALAQQATGAEGGRPSLAEALSDARTGAERIQHLVRELHDFTHPTESQQEWVDLHQALERSVKMALHQVEHRARLVRVYGEPPKVLANEGQLGQIFLNLLINAAQAIPEGAADRNEVRVSTWMGPDGSAIVEVADTGRGMSPDEVQRAFDPFFTTKVTGLGLGLAIAQGAVRALRGELTVESALGRGSTFRVRLPSAQPGTATGPVLNHPERMRGQSLRILLVEDDQHFAGSLGAMLRFDHEVVVHPQARRALEVLSVDPDFDVVLCDVMMPEMTGQDFFEELARVAPRVRERVIFMTGGAFTPAMRAFLDQVPNPRIAKPFRQTELEHAFRALRGESPGGTRRKQEKPTGGG